MNEMIDKTLFRMNMLGGMNEYVLNVIGDEDIIDQWITYGVPDSPTEDDLKYIATHDDLWMDVVKEFNCVLEIAKDWKLEY